MARESTTIFWEKRRLGRRIENLFRIQASEGGEGKHIFCDNAERETMRESWKIKKFVVFATLFFGARFDFVMAQVVEGGAEMEDARDRRRDD